MASNDNVRVFVDECVIADKDGAIVKKFFSDVYARWCDAYGERAVSDKVLRDSLQKIIPNLDEHRRSAKDPREWIGMSWSEDAQNYFPRKREDKSEEAYADDAYAKEYGDRPHTGSQ
jgi:phage/plasmid-associated DNA primase